MFKRLLHFGMPNGKLPFVQKRAAFAEPPTSMESREDWVWKMVTEKKTRPVFFVGLAHQNATMRLGATATIASRKTVAYRYD